MDPRPGKDMPPDNRENIDRTTLEREPGVVCSIILVKARREETLKKELTSKSSNDKWRLINPASLPLTSIKQVKLTLSPLTNPSQTADEVSFDPNQETDQVRSQLLLPARSAISSLNWDTEAHQPTQFLVKLPTDEPWEWSNQNEEHRGRRLLEPPYVHGLNAVDRKYPSDSVKEVWRIEQLRQLAVARWLLIVYQTDYALTPSEAKDAWEVLRDAVLIDQQPLSDTTRLYQDIFSDYTVTNDQFLHAVRLATFAEELVPLEFDSVSQLEKQLGLVAALPDLTSDDIRWVAPHFPQLQDYLVKMGIATKTTKQEPAQGLLAKELKPAPPVTDVLDWQYPDDQAAADTMLLERFGIDDFEAARDQYQLFKEYLNKQIKHIFDLGGLGDQFDPDTLRIDSQLAHSSMLDQVTFAQKVIGVYEIAPNSADTPAQRLQADVKRFEARLMASCLEYIAPALRRQKVYRSFRPTVVQLLKNLGYDWKSESQKPASEAGETILNLQSIDADGTPKQIPLPVRMHFREEKFAHTMIEKMFRDGNPTDLRKDTDFFACSIEVLLPFDDPLLAKEPAPESLNFWKLHADGSLSEIVTAEPPTDHAAVFHTMRSVITEIKGLLAQEKPEVRIIKYQPTGSFKGRSKGSRSEHFPGMSRFAIHVKTTVRTWAYPQGSLFMKEFQLFFPTWDKTATENFAFKMKDERIEEGITYQLLRVEELALLFSPPRFYPQMRFLERAYQAAKARVAPA